MHFLRRWLPHRWNLKHAASRNKQRTARRKALLETLESRSLLAGDFGFAHGLGSTGSDVAHAVAADSCGNVYVTGEFRGTVDFDPSAGTTALTAPSASTGGTFVAKYSTTGALLWAKQVSATTFNWGEDLTLDSAGDLWVLGRFSGTADFDPGAGQANITARNGGSERFLLKLDSDGNYLSAGAFQGGFFGGVAADQSGNVYLTGQFSGTADLNPGPGDSTLTSNGGFDAFVSKVGSDGNLIWAKNFGSSNTNFNDDFGQDIAVDASGNPIVTGIFIGATDFDPGAATVSRTPSGPKAVFTTKFDTNGNFQWVAIINSSGTEPQDIVADADGSVIATGGLQGTVDFDPSDSTSFNLTAPNGFYGAYIVKLDGSGGFQWAKELGTTANSSAYGYGLSLGANGDLVSTGQFLGTGDFDPGAGVFNITAVPSTIDIYVSRLSSSGNFISARAMGGSLIDRGRSIAFSSAASGVFVVGQFNGTADFDPGAATVNRISNGADEVFVAKLYTAPYFTSPAAFAVDENATQVTTLAATDPEEQTVTYSISGGGDAALFSVDENSGALSFNAPPNFEDLAHGPVYLVQIAASDGTNTGTINLTINVSNVNEQPTLIELSSQEISEGLPAATVVGTLTTIDPDAADVFAYELVAGEGDAGNAAFVIEEDLLKTAEILDANVQAGYSIRVRSTDFQGLHHEQTFVITVLSDNAPPQGDVLITGDAIEDGVLTADVSGLSDSDGLGELHYQWQRSTNNFASFTNVGNDSNQYTLGDADVGSQLRVVVSYLDGEGTNESVTSAASGQVQNVNDAPQLDNTLNPTLVTIWEDATNPLGTLVSALLAGAVTDADSAALQGIAVTGAPGMNGAWQYSIDGGTSWQNMGSPSPEGALLLPDSARVRFLPQANFNGQVSLFYNAWDQTEGSTGGTLPVAGNTGEDHSLSTAFESAGLTVTARNDAPVLNTALNPTLGTIAEDTKFPPAVNVSLLIAGAVTDPDAGALRGIAVTGAAVTNGVWQYRITGSNVWKVMAGNISDVDALLLPSTAGTQVRFIPKAEFSGTVRLSYRAWDRTQGLPGETFNAGSNRGGDKSCSLQVESSPLVISTVNDLPVLQFSGSINYVHDNPAVTLAPFATVADVDSANFGTGQLRVRIGTGGSSSNRLAIGAGFTVDSQKNVKQGSTIIGKLMSSGFGTSELIVKFNFAATTAIVQQLIRSITFKTVGGAAGQRAVLFSVSDGDGGTSAEVTKTVNVT